MGWIKDILDPKFRKWEDFYRNRFQHDKVVRSTHGVNCTGGCSWNVYVKNGIVTWELQALDYPEFDPDLPPCEPRGCPRGISFSWYIYSPLRVKYPYIRGVLWDLWKEAKRKHNDPVSAWESIVSNSELRKKYQQARGKGGFRRVKWDDCLEIICASLIYTIKKYGPDRIIGFSPIPAMSMLSYAAGSRFLQLIGGVCLSFYDWYCDLPNASPEVWGEQTDVGESADWFNARFIAVMGSNVNMTRTPDAHFLVEARHRGTKVVVFSPDFSQVSKHADEWIAIRPGEDNAFWMAVNHVILKEYIHEKKEPYFINYLKQFTDTPFLVKLEKKGSSWIAGKFLKASDLKELKEEENSEWKPCIWDIKTDKPDVPVGTIGHRWQSRKGQWNLKLISSTTGDAIDPALTFLGSSDGEFSVEFNDPASGKSYFRQVPVKFVETEGGRIPVTTVLDLLFARFGVSRGLSGDYPSDYSDESPYTPAWQESYTGVSPDVILRFARQWAETARVSKGKCMIIIGAGVNHWYHNNLNYRSAILALLLTGSVGTNGGGLNHYVGQEKVVPLSAWATLAFAGDWLAPPKLQNTPSFHYIHTDQWRYESAVNHSKNGTHPFFSVSHTAEYQVKAVRLGWLPFYPQLNVNPIKLTEELAKKGKTSLEEVKKEIVEALKNGSLKFAVENPDAPENWPRVWFIWRGNAIMSSAKGHEYFLRHYLGTHDNIVKEEADLSALKEIDASVPAPRGKLDLVVDLNFRMDTSALYSDIVLPAATWYEKDDLNSTDLHSYIHPLQAAVPPCWESKSDWDIFKAIAKKFSEMAEVHFPEPVKDLILTPLLHDTPAELAQPSVKDWKKGEVEPIPGKTMPGIAMVERRYPEVYKQFISLGPRVAELGVGAHGIMWKADDLYEELIKHRPVERWNGKVFPSLKEARDAANVLLYLAPETNGRVAYRAFKEEESKTGVTLTDIAEGYRNISYSFDDLVAHPCRSLPSPIWSGIPVKGRAYAPYCLNVEKLVPWRTLTGRQHTYLDHEAYIYFGENLPVYKPKLTPEEVEDLTKSSPPSSDGMALNYLTPHGKWQIHSTYSENLRMLTLSRGCFPLWLSFKDAEKLGIKDNDWVEVYNDNGVVVTRAIVTHRLPPGICMIYHATERTVGVPRSPLRNGKRAGGHNSLTRARLKPVLMSGGYAHFTYFFNYWGPVGVNRETFVYVRKLPDRPRW